jgi:transposase
MTSEELVSDTLWGAVEPLLPPEVPKPKGGRLRRDDRAIMGGIIYVTGHRALRATGRHP